MRRLAHVPAILGCLLALPAASHAQPLKLGFADGVFSENPLANPWYARAVDAGADQIDLTLGWASVAPRKPAGDPTDPANPGYDFSGIDELVRAADGAGLEVILRIAGAPAWSDGPDRPASATPGTWKTDPEAYGAFATAAARHYDGAHGLPRIRLWQAGGEVNLSTYFAPQWVRKRTGEPVPVAPRLYRAILNAFYAGVKSVSPDNVVISAGLAPFGDAPGGRRMAPALFLREMLCLKGHTLVPAKCEHPAHLDAISHHPYSVGGPDDAALVPDDVSVADLGKLTRVVRKARRTGRVLPGTRKGLYVTEFSWDGSPPDPDGVPERKRARWIAEAFERFWRQGVSSVVWYQIRDMAGPDFPATYQSGVYTYGGRAKLGLRAYRFPFVVRLDGRHPARAWGRAPVAGVVRVQQRDGKRWRTVWRTRVALHGVFHRRLHATGKQVYRATIGGQTSLAYRPR